MNGSIILVWFVVCLALMVFAFAYFPSVAVVLAIINAGTAFMPNSSPQIQATLNIYCNSVIWAGIMFLFGMIGYAFISSRKKEYVEYER